MSWQVMVALIFMIPVILFPVAFVWYLNIGGVYAMLKDMLQREAAKRKHLPVV